MTPLRIDKGRSVLIFSHDWLAIQTDGRTVTGIKLSDGDKQELETALRVSRDISKCPNAPD